jgi:hypothetical protein
MEMFKNFRFEEVGAHSTRKRAAMIKFPQYHFQFHHILTCDVCHTSSRNISMKHAVLLCRQCASLCDNVTTPCRAVAGEPMGST